MLIAEYIFQPIRIVVGIDIIVAIAPIIDELSFIVNVTLKYVSINVIIAIRKVDVHAIFAPFAASLAQNPINAMVAIIMMTISTIMPIGWYINAISNYYYSCILYLAQIIGYEKLT